jgi:threonine/homoserine/homoserine lactone efflux protein
VTQVLVLGATFIGLGLVTDGTYAVVAAYFADRWRARRAQRRVARAERLSGVVFVGLGVLAAVTPRHTARR